MFSDYTKKPVTIQACQLLLTNHDEMKRLLRARGEEVDDLYDNAGQLAGIKIVTLEGVHEVGYGWYIIRGIAGEYYGCREDIFLATYSKD